MIDGRSRIETPSLRSDILWYVGLFCAFTAIAATAEPKASLPLLLVIMYAIDSLFYRHGTRRFFIPAHRSRAAQKMRKLAMLSLVIVAVLSMGALAWVIASSWIPLIQARDIIDRLPSMVAVTASTNNEEQQAAVREALASLSAGDLARIAQVADRLPRELSVLAHYDLGVVAYQHNHLDEASVHFSKAVVLDKTLVDAHYNLGRIHQRGDRHAEAVKSFIDAEHFGGESGDTKYCLAVSYWQLGRLAESESAARAALKLFPADSPWRQKCQVLLGRIVEDGESSVE